MFEVVVVFGCVLLLAFELSVNKVHQYTNTYNYVALISVVGSYTRQLQGYIINVTKVCPAEVQSILHTCPQIS